MKPDYRSSAMLFIAGALLSCGSNESNSISARGAGGTAGSAGQRGHSGSSGGSALERGGAGPAGISAAAGTSHGGAGAAGEAENAGISGSTDDSSGGTASGGSAGLGGAASGGTASGGSAGLGGTASGGSTGLGGTASGGSAGLGGTASGGSAGLGGTGGVPPTGAALRFLNAAPSTSNGPTDAIDVCVKLSSAASFDGPPLFEKLGLDRGLYFRTISAPFTFALDTALYDFVFVESARSDCQPPWLARMNNRLVDRDTVIALTQSSLTAPAYTGIQLDASHAHAHDGLANIRFFLADKGNQTVDVYARFNDPVSPYYHLLWFFGVPSLGSTDFYSTTPGNYALTIDTHLGSTLIQTLGGTVGADEKLDIFMYWNGSGWSLVTASAP